MKLAEWARQDGVTVEKYYSTALMIVQPPATTDGLYDLEDYRVVIADTLGSAEHFTLHRKRAKRRPRIE